MEAAGGEEFCAEFSTAVRICSCLANGAESDYRGGALTVSHRKAPLSLRDSGALQVLKDCRIRRRAAPRLGSGFGQKCSPDRLTSAAADRSTTNRFPPLLGSRVFRLASTCQLDCWAGGLVFVLWGRNPQLPVTAAVLCVFAICTRCLCSGRCLAVVRDLFLFSH